MAWIKIPKEHHPIFLDALPPDDRIMPKQMFGAIAAMVNGHMMGGLFAHSVMLRLGKRDYDAAIAAGAEPFDPMGNGHVMADTVMMPESHFRDRKLLGTWLAKALAFTASLPPKAAKPSKVARAPERKAAKKAPAKKIAARKSAAKKR